MAQIELSNISHTYNPNDLNPTYALNPFSMTWENGKRYAILGPSGCGKTTMLNIVSGLVKPSKGNILFDGNDVTNLITEERNIAQVFQFPVIYNTMTVYENLAFPLKCRDFSKEKIEEQLEKVSKFLQVDQLLERKPSQLSGGQRQRVAIGRALVREPRIFLFDEPLSNLDAKLRVEMRREIKKLHQQLKTTVVYVTHDQTEAMSLGTRIAIMNHGVIQQNDTPENIYNKPSNTFVADFIGSPSMNLIKGTLKETSGKIFFASSSVSWTW